MIHKLSGRRSKRLRKRTTLPRLLLRGLLTAAAVSAVFAFAYREVLLNMISSESSKQITERMFSLQSHISGIEKEPENIDRMNMMNAHLMIYSNFSIEIYDPITDFLEYPYPLSLNSNYSPENLAVAALVDENGDYAASNEVTGFTHIKFSEGNHPDNGRYFLNRDMSIPGMKKFIDDYNELHELCGSDGFIEEEFDSIYYNTADRTFIPRTGRLTLNRVKDPRQVSYEDAESTVEETREINIELESGEYRVIDKSSGTKSPRFIVTIIAGESIDRIKSESGDFGTPGGSYSGYSAGFRDNGTYTVRRSTPVRIGDKPYLLSMKFVVNIKDPGLMKNYAIRVVLFTVLAFVTAALVCWRKNVLNKAQYAFEDYQRALTNNLAHDLKTPLAVIGGYAENLLQMRKDGSEKELAYLRSILNNVSFADDIIQKTLKLSKTEQISKPGKTDIDIIKLAESLAEKYRTSLGEHGITLTTEGSGTVSADGELLTEALENLISNAVKYTPDGGSISIEADRKHISVVNDTAEDIDVKDLTMPFVKGDKARSDKRSSGLGLSIASAAAERNGHTLRLECSGRRFKAELCF